MSMFTDDVILPIAPDRIPLLLEEIAKVSDYAVIPYGNPEGADAGLLGTVGLDFCDTMQYLHFIKGNDEESVVAFFEGNPAFIEMLESDGLLATLNAVTNFFAIGGVKLELQEPEKPKVPSLGSLTIKILQCRGELRAKILEELGIRSGKGRVIYAALEKLEDAKLILLAHQIRTQNETWALNQKADAMQEELNKPGPTPTPEKSAAEPAPEAAAPETPAPIVHEYPVYRNPTLLGFVAGSVAVVGAALLVRRLLK